MTIHLTGFKGQVGAESAHHQPRVTGTGRKTFYANVLKRGLDVAAVVLSLPLVAPIILILAALVSLNGGRPFYWQHRIGRNGEVFRMWKLRTMVVNADECLAEYLAANPEARREWEQMQKLKNDPRITAFGHFLRKTSLDELPQLFNVLNGTMSLVGPRPMMLFQQASYGGDSYYWLRPGLTGFWQISNRNECGFAKRVRYDNAYYRAVSLRTDLIVLFRTIFVVMRGTGY